MEYADHREPCHIFVLHSGIRTDAQHIRSETVDACQCYDYLFDGDRNVRFVGHGSSGKSYRQDRAYSLDHMRISNGRARKSRRVNTFASGEDR